tara:strand:- start:8229 stop:10220 length:1992 start_codon:yes stop_codon:yes gene_type:complete
MKHWVMDYETLLDCFTGVFENYKTSEKKVFVISRLRNDLKEFIEFLKENIQKNEWHISYNGLAFDAQVTHYILDNYKNWIDLDDAAIANLIYKYAQSCIIKSRNKDFQDYPLWKMKIGQVDLFKLHHWDNPAKRSSLKWIQYSMDWENILEMPIHHETEIHTQSQLDTVLEYCINDVRSTKEIFNKSKSQIKLRQELTKQYDINLFSASEPRISKELFSYYLCKKLNIQKREIKNMRTYRDIIKVKDIILPYISFKSATLQNLLNRFKSLELNPESLKGSFKYAIDYMNVNTHFGLGGVHGAVSSGIYKSDGDYVIMSSDVTSFYPNLVIKNSWSPGHFPSKEFCDQYEWFFEERKKIPKSNPMNYVYKIILNSTFGLSNDANSFFYDPELCMRITVNGQLSLMMLYEMIMENIPEATALMQNTDGVEVKIPRNMVDKYMEICEKWEKITNLNLEHDKYQRLIIGDVNNYIGVNYYKEVDLSTWRKIKESNPHYMFKVKNSKFLYAPIKIKGRFNFHELALHKNKSKLIIKKAIFHYFVHDILPEDYLDDNKNILDYCIGGKSKGNWKQVAKKIKDGKLVTDNLQKINRYYISTSGVKIVKVNNQDDREIQLESGKWLQTTFNKIQIKPKWEDYNIDKSYYMRGIESEINNILNVNKNQLKLF